jgi:hypothetical protein
VGAADRVLAVKYLSVAGNIPSISLNSAERNDGLTKAHLVTAMVYFQSLISLWTLLETFRAMSPARNHRTPFYASRVRVRV